MTRTFEQRTAALTQAAQARRAAAESLSTTDLYEALRAPDGLRLAREALRKHLGRDLPRLSYVVDLVEQSFPAEHRARLEREEAERKAAEKRRRQAAREAREAARDEAQNAAIRQRVEQLRSERQAAADAELLETARAELAAK